MLYKIYNIHYIYIYIQGCQRVLSTLQLWICGYTSTWNIQATICLMCLEKKALTTINTRWGPSLVGNLVSITRLSRVYREYVFNWFWLYLYIYMYLYVYTCLYSTDFNWVNFLRGHHLVGKELSYWNGCVLLMRHLVCIGIFIDVSFLVRMDLSSNSFSILSGNLGWIQSSIEVFERWWFRLPSDLYVQNHTSPTPRLAFRMTNPVGCFDRLFLFLCVFK